MLERIRFMWMRFDALTGFAQNYGRQRKVCLNMLATRRYLFFRILEGTRTKMPVAMASSIIALAMLLRGLRG
jgi:hypothetical protein